MLCCQIHEVKCPEHGSPGRQLLQAPGPVQSLYFPAMHAEHVPPLEPVNPVLHLQSEIESLWAGEEESAMMTTSVCCKPDLADHLVRGAV